MQTFADMKERLTDELMSADTSSLFTEDRKEKLIQDAHLWATSLYQWPELQVAKKTTVPNIFGGDQYMDYPEEYLTDTMAEYIYVDGKPFKRKSWPDFIEHQRLNPTSTERYFADYGRQIFLFPHQAVGLEVVLWGQVQATQITEDTDITIFSKHSDAGNEAIVRKALSVGVKRIDRGLSEREEKAAAIQLSIIWKKIQDRQQYSQPINKPMFNIPDFFKGNGGYRERNFDLD